MKHEHTFKCGIVGTANNAEGDRFLADMVDGERFDEIKMIERIQAPVRAELKRTQQALYYLVLKAGGTVRIPDTLILGQLPKPVGEWSVYRNEAECEIVIRVRPSSAPTPDRGAGKAEKT